MTRKITRALAHILAGKQRKLYLGNLEAKRDWGYTPEYVEAMWLILQQEEPDDYVIGTGESHSVREFVETAFSYAGIEIEWKGEGREERGVVRSVSRGNASEVLKPGDVIVEIDPRYFRPVEVENLLADPSKAKRKLGWEPRVTFKELVKIMVDCDMELCGLAPPGEGKELLKRYGILWTENRLTVG